MGGNEGEDAPQDVTDVIVVGVFVVFVRVVRDVDDRAEEELLKGFAVGTGSRVGVVPVFFVAAQVDGRTSSDFSVRDAFMLRCVDSKHGVRIDRSSVHLVSCGIAIETNAGFEGTRCVLVGSPFDLLLGELVAFQHVLRTAIASPSITSRSDGVVQDLGLVGKYLLLAPRAVETPAAAIGAPNQSFIAC